MVSRFRITSTSPKNKLSENSLADYLVGIGEFRLLTKSDEIELFTAIAKGLEAYQSVMKTCSITEDQEKIMAKSAAAYEVLIGSNLRLVTSIAMKFKASHMDKMTDLIQEGVLGLSRAISNFDIRRNQKLSTYATWWIKQSVARYIANYSRTIRLPVHQNEHWRKMMGVERKLTQMLQRKPSYEEIAAALGTDLEKVVMLKRAGQLHLTSLNQHVKADSETELGHLTPDQRLTEEITASADSLDITRAINEIFESGGLSISQMQVLSLRFGIFRPELSGKPIIGYNGESKRTYDECFADCVSKGSLTWDQISAETGLSVKQVRTLEGKILRQLQFALPKLRSMLQ